MQNVSFEVDSGTRVGISGTTGAGKTTLVSLLTRFYDPTAGQIMLDGVDLRDYKLADLRNQFAIVLQEPVLFSTSIAENIAYARPDATEEEIVAAAKAANAHEFITACPTATRPRSASGACASRGRAPAHRAGPGLPEGRPDPHPRRAHQLRRYEDRGLIMEAMTRLMRGAPPS